jgi:hypothetical protein
MRCKIISIHTLDELHNTIFRNTNQSDCSNFNLYQSKKLKEESFWQLYRLIDLIFYHRVKEYKNVKPIGNVF